jgi:hypothetical protein
MQQGHQLCFSCIQCSHDVIFSVLNDYTASDVITCTHCDKEYVFDTTIASQLEKFEALCRQIHLSQDILGDASIAVSVDNREVKIPYKILLTRLNSVMTLSIGSNEDIAIRFRVEPIDEIQKTLC